MKLSDWQSESHPKKEANHYAIKLHPESLRDLCDSYEEHFQPFCIALSWGMLRALSA